jgi:hypothetical protein
MHQNSLANLQKWAKGTSGNSADREVGSKNIATIVRELLGQDIARSLSPSCKGSDIIIKSYSWVKDR